MIFSRQIYIPEIYLVDKLEGVKVDKAEIYFNV